MAMYGVAIKPAKVILTEAAKQLVRLADHARKLKAERKTLSSDKLYGAKK